ncbi:MAG: sigma-54-dependent Fis family transcriptional regulator [Candidatus Tectimicrobiota bacterium]|nr:MAG: sigma-54-dependent Fis family transcriptional regulator [Candidatus Tectomicrobia bacterium]
MSAKILLVEDDEALCAQLRWALKPEFEVLVAGDGECALALFRQERPAVVTLDLGLPPDPHAVSEGFRVLQALLRADPDVKVIVITGQEERRHALEAIAQGAYDFFRKPIQLEELRLLLRRALHVYQLEQEYRALRQHLEQQGFEDMLGTSPQMQEVFNTVRKVAATDAPVLIMGESGTGKEMVARAIHRHSRRRSGPFVAINCGAIPETLLESELFGHERGAFTGAHVQRKGRIELAQGGTLFLDEIGELPLALQVKLLRFLQEYELERLGGREAIPVDVRVLAATKVDLQQAMAAGRFREDLYYRLGVIVITLPPLRERGDDVLVLAKALLQRYAREYGKPITGFDRQALLALQRHSWPGNVRELENRLKRAVILAEGPKITPEDLELTSPYAKYEGQGLRAAREALEKELIQRALARHQGNVTRTAAELGVSRPTLHELINKYGLKR